MSELIDNIDKYISEAVAHYWRTRTIQKDKQTAKGVSDAGLRSAVTGGAQMDGFIGLFTDVIVDAGMKKAVYLGRNDLNYQDFSGLRKNGIC